MIDKNGVRLYNYIDLSKLFGVTQEMLIFLFKKLEMNNTRMIINRKCYITQDILVEFTTRYHNYLKNARRGRKRKNIDNN